jgi:acyl carrier protein
MNIVEKIIDVLEATGIYFDKENEGDDSDMREYIIDSFQFINFIVELEKELDMEFPDEALVYDNLASLNGFAAMVQSIVDGTYTTIVKTDSMGKEKQYELN